MAKQHTHMAGNAPAQSRKSAILTTAVALALTLTPMGAFAKPAARTHPAPQVSQIDREWFQLLDRGLAHGGKLSRNFSGVRLRS
jgi:hypothetical protein